MAIDLEEMSLKDLKDLQGKVAKAISGFEDRKKRQALAELEEKAREMGFSLAELTGAAPARKRSPSVVKYRNPADPSQTWTGRGRKPGWYDAALKSGKTPGDLMV